MKKRTPTELFIVAETHVLSHLSSQLVQVVCSIFLQVGKKLYLTISDILKTEFNGSSIAFLVSKFDFAAVIQYMYLVSTKVGRYICTKFRPFSTPSLISFLLKKFSKHDRIYMIQNTKRLLISLYVCKKKHLIKLDVTAFCLTALGCKQSQSNQLQHKKFLQM